MRILFQFVYPNCQLIEESFFLVGISHLIEECFRRPLLLLRPYAVKYASFSFTIKKTICISSYRVMFNCHQSCMTLLRICHIIFIPRKPSASIFLSFSHASHLSSLILLEISGHLKWSTVMVAFGALAQIFFIFNSRPR